jgi:hypothetical protein
MEGRQEVILYNLSTIVWTLLILIFTSTGALIAHNMETK